MELIKEGKFVAVTYDLFVADDQETGEELMESASKETPLQFVFGKGMMLESFEARLANSKVGEKFDFKLSPAEAYGEYVDENLVELPKNIFEVEGKFDTEIIYEGNIVPMLDSEGNRHNALILEIKNDTVQLDFNHPLAGEELHFMGEVITVRDATEEDLKTCEGGCEGGDCGGCGGGCSCGH